MTITNGYTTLADFKAYAIPEGSTDATDDTVIEAIIEAASRWLDLQIGQKYYTSANDETRYFTADNYYRLQTGSIVSVTSISLDSGNNRTWGYTLPATDYDLTPYNASLDGIPYSTIEISPISAYSFPLFEKGVKIVGKFGWPTAPKYITEACKELSRTIYHRRTGQNIGGQATITAAGVVIEPQDISDFVRSVIVTNRSRV